MPDPLDIRFQPEIAEFVRVQARAANRSATEFVESILLREKARIEEGGPEFAVQTTPDLLGHERHDLVRDPDETPAEHDARSELFSALLHRARHG